MSVKYNVNLLRYMRRSYHTTRVNYVIRNVVEYRQKTNLLNNWTGVFFFNEN